MPNDPQYFFTFCPMSHSATPMSPKERLFHAVLFEMGAILLTMLIFAVFDSGNATHTGTLAVIISLIAVGWNMAFNWIFDKVFTGERLHRTLGVRLLHMGLFEGGLLMMTVPLIAYTLGVSLWQALLMDISIVLVIGGYTLLFHWVYDYVRHGLMTKPLFDTIPQTQQKEPLMKQRIWQTTYQNTKILVKNQWDWQGNTKEEIWIDGKQVYDFAGCLGTIPTKRCFGFCQDFYVNDTKITIRAGSAWHLCGMACQILINDRHYDGDGIVLFTPKIKES